MTPTLRFEVGSTVVPGDRVGSIRQVTPGIGTYSRGGHVYASAVGTLTLSSSSAQQQQQPNDNQRFIVSVELPRGRYFASTNVLSVGQLVLGKVVRLVMQQVVIDIVAAQGAGGALRHSTEGIIRKEDVRTKASEEIPLYDSFRPGDVVLCKILSLGDSRRYYLTTAETELGVVRAVCNQSGKLMVPISWKEMQCPETNVKELRKCAKPTNLITKASFTK